MSNTTKTTNKTFTWNVRSIHIVRDSRFDYTPTLTARLDILGTPGSTASMTDLHVDLQNRLNGKTTTIPEIKNVIFNPPATIVLWSDNTKTVVKCQDGDEFNHEHGLAMAIVKKMYGNTGKYCEIFKKWIKEEDVPCDYPKMTIDPKLLENNPFADAIEKIKKAASTSTASINETLAEFARKEAAKTLAEKLEKETGWIATTHKLPCTKGDYLVYDTFTGSSYVYEYDNSNLNDVIYWQRHITHWMPVPAAPGTKKGE